MHSMHQLIRYLVRFMTTLYPLMSTCAGHVTTGLLLLCQHPNCTVLHDYNLPFVNQGTKGIVGRNLTYHCHRYRPHARCQPNQ